MRAEGAQAIFTLRHDSFKEEGHRELGLIPPPPGVSVSDLAVCSTLAARFYVCGTRRLIEIGPSSTYSHTQTHHSEV